MADEKSSPPFKLPLSAVVVVFLLTLAVWIFFYQMEMQLNPQSTLVVAAIMLILVGGVRWIWLRTHPKPASAKEESK